MLTVNNMNLLKNLNNNNASYMDITGVMLIDLVLIDCIFMLIFKVIFLVNVPVKLVKC